VRSRPRAVRTGRDGHSERARRASEFVISTNGGVSMEEAETRTLFERVGGAAGVERIVEAFYERVEGDLPLRKIYPDDLEPGKAKLKLYLEQWLGGEPRYSELYGHPRLRMRHLPFAIGEHAAGRWLRHMRAAMQASGVGEAEERVIFAQLAPLAHHMVNRHDEGAR